MDFNVTQRLQWPDEALEGDVVDHVKFNHEIMVHTQPGDEALNDDYILQ